MSGWREEDGGKGKGRDGWLKERREGEGDRFDKCSRICIFHPSNLSFFLSFYSYNFLPISPFSVFIRIFCPSNLSFSCLFILLCSSIFHSLCFLIRIFCSSNLSFFSSFYSYFLFFQSSLLPLSSFVFSVLHIFHSFALFILFSPSNLPLFVSFHPYFLSFQSFLLPF